MKLKSLMQSIKDHFDRTKADFLKHCISLIPMLEIIFFAITKRQSQAEEEAIKFQLLQEKKNHFSQDAPPASPPRRSTRDHLLSKHQVDARQTKSDFLKAIYLFPSQKFSCFLEGRLLQLHLIRA